MIDHLSPHFSRGEFACRCGCGFDTVDTALIPILEEIRERTGYPIIVLSGCRCPDHNQAIGGAERSYHLQGRAADIRLDDPWDIYGWLCHNYPKRYGFGYYPWGVHIDTRSGIASRWT